MIIGILGKGGSGKSTVASQLALYFSVHGKNILGIDADYNMDFAFNVFGGNLPEEIPYFGTSKHDMKSFVGAEVSAKYSESVLSSSGQKFLLSEKGTDSFTQKYMIRASEHLGMLVCGPETDDVLYGISCGHALSAPLKLYLPLLAVAKDSMVILDEKAGADGANSGILSGCDCVFIVTDPSLHGIKTALQIARLADFFETPYSFIANKIQTVQDLEYVAAQLPRQKIYAFRNDPVIARFPNTISAGNTEFFSSVEQDILKTGDNQMRLARSKKKFLAEKMFQR